MNRNRFVVLLAVAALLAALLNSSTARAGRLGRPLAQAGAPALVSYQGQVTVNGMAYSGSGYFKFAVVNAAGDESYWSNDGTSTGGGEPATAVTLTVSAGLFNVLLGDPAAGMSALDAAAFDGTGRYLRVWFSSDSSTFIRLSPDRRIAAVPYALQAEEAKNAAALGGMGAEDFVQQGQANSITGTMIAPGSVLFSQLAQNGCSAGQVPQWNGTAWVCANTTGVSVHGLLSGLLADDHPQYFNLGQNEIITGTPAFNGGTSGSTPPFSVDSTTAVANLNADLLDGLQASAFANASHTHQTLTAGTGLSGGSYNGGTATTFSVAYGTASGTAVQGNQTATITAGNGLTGGISGDALGDGFAATLNVVGGSGITANADNLALGPLSANWNQTGAYDVVLNNANSELQMLAANGTYFGTFDVGSLSASQTYSFTTGGTVWTSGNDGSGSGLNADRLDGLHAGAFAPAGSAWALTGNAGTSAATNFIGTTDNVSFTVRVSNTTALRIIPDYENPTLLGGYSGNWITPGVYGSVIAGGGASGYLNRVTDNYGAVGGGTANQAGDNAGTTIDKQYAVVAGGRSNQASGGYCAVAGGSSNTASGAYCTVGGGYGNRASSTNSAVAGGSSNTASGYSSAVAGGSSNTASGSYATAAGGYANAAAGNYSFAAGNQARANANGCFAWGDSTTADATCSTTNAWVARASGGVTFYTNAGMTIGARLPAGGSSWEVVSDRNLKANFQPVDTQAVLQKVAAMPVSTWNYTSQDEAIRHIGPMAQDFAAAFGVGEDDTHIATIDADGVALAAIQGLYSENQGLKAQVTTLKQQNAGLEARLSAVEQASGLRPAPAANFWLLALGGAAVVLLASAWGWAWRCSGAGVRLKVNGEALR